MSVYDRFNTDTLTSGPSSGMSSTKIIVIILVIAVVLIAAVGIGFLIWWLVRRNGSTPQPVVPILIPSFNRKIKVNQLEDGEPSDPAPTGVWVKYGIAGSDTANPSNLTFTAITDPVYVLGTSTITGLAPGTANANATFTITAQNSKIKFLTIGVQDSLTMNGRYSSWHGIKTIANTGVAIPFSEGIEAFVPGSAYSGSTPGDYTEAKSEALLTYLKGTYVNLDTSDIENMIVYETGGTELTPA